MPGSLRKSLVGAAIAVGVSAATLIASSESASARLVCNRWGQCWHTRPYYYGGYYGPYYDPYYSSYYDPYYGPGYYSPYYYGPGYYGPDYGYAYGPSIGFGFSFGGGHHFHHR
jgi:hypothetical protein